MLWPVPMLGTLKRPGGRHEQRLVRLLSPGISCARSTQRPLGPAPMSGTRERLGGREEQRPVRLLSPGNSSARSTRKVGLSIGRSLWAPERYVACVYHGDLFLPCVRQRLHLDVFPGRAASAGSSPWKNLQVREGEQRTGG